ncbi:MAG: DUF6584 family protein [Bacteroidota bacterium]
MKTQEKLKSVQKDIAKGLKSKAMDRLHGLIQAHPSELAFRKELGRLYLSVDWKEKAGLYLLLSETPTEKEKEAIEIYRKSVHNSAYEILHSLKFKGDRQHINLKALEILEKLEERSLEENGIVPRFHHLNPNKTKREYTVKNSFKENLGLGCVVVVLISLPIFAIIGLIQVIKWIW